MARLGICVVADVSGKAIHLSIDGPLSPVLWVHGWVISFTRIYIDPNFTMGDQIKLVDISGREYTYIAKDHDEETLEWKLVWPD